MSKPRRHSHDTRKGNESFAELTAHLKPLEELVGEKSPTGPLNGAIRVDDQVPVPKGVIEPEPQGWLGIERLVLIIAGLMLAFIAFITWQVYLMTGPAKP